VAVTSMANSSLRDFQKFNNMGDAHQANFIAVQYLVLGGGSGGAAGSINVYSGSGGAAGVARSGTSVTQRARPQSLMVGAGSSGISRFNPVSGSGGSSSFSDNTATGGNGTANSSRVGGTNNDFSGGGNPGGSNSGGGAGAGANGSSQTGGSGHVSAITGTSVTRGGGGGGAMLGVGGAGGGGRASTAGAGGGTNGDVNTGSGGGGGNHTWTAWNGGSGVVIFSLSSTAIVTFSAGVTQTSAVVGTNRVYTVTAAGPTDTMTIG